MEGVRDYGNDNQDNVPLIVSLIVKDGANIVGNRNQNEREK